MHGMENILSHILRTNSEETRPKLPVTASSLRAQLEITRTTRRSVGHVPEGLAFTVWKTSWILFLEVAQ